MNLQIFIPRKRNLHGSDMSNVNIWKEAHTIMHYELSRSEMRSVDQTNQRCSDEREAPNFSKCLVEYLEAKTNCSFQLHWSDKVKTKCNLSRADSIWNTSDSQWVNKILVEYRGASESKLHKMSGCVPPCNLRHYTLTPYPDYPKHLEYHGNPEYQELHWNTLDISVTIPVSEYKIYQQVIFG